MTSQTLALRLLSSAKTHRERLALWIAGAEYSYQALFDAACTLAAEIDRTAPPNAPVSIIGRPTFSSYTAILAAILCGRPFAPVSPDEPFERNQQRLEILKPGALVCDAATRAAAERHADALGGGLRIYMTDESGVVSRLPDTQIAPTPLDAFEPTAGLDSSAYILFTSGTTGTPKGVRMLHRNMVSYLDAVAQFAPVTAQDRCTQIFAFTFDPTIHDLFVSWSVGASVWPVPMEDRLNRLDFIRRHAITSWYSGPVAAANAEQLGQLTPDAAPSLRYSSFVGEALPTSVMIAWQRACPNAAIYNLYGPTEAGPTITYQKFDAHSAMVASPTVPIGVANPGSFAVVVDAQGVPVAPGEEGELMIGGPQVGPGYINNPEANATRFFEADIAGSGPQRWYRTGDLVLNDPDIGLVFKCRLDDQLKIGGYRVEMQEIEDALRKAAETATVAVVPMQDNGMGGAAAVYGFIAGSKLAHPEILKACRAILPKALVPRRLFDVAELPLNSSGKVDRKVLKALADAPREAADAAPGGPDARQKRYG